MQRTKVLFLILPKVHLLDLAGPDQVFLEAIGYQANLEIAYCGLEKQQYTSAALPFGELSPYTDFMLKQGDLLLVPGAELSYLESPEFKRNHLLFDWIRACREQKVKICSICSGSFVLAESGILDGRDCTTHWKRTSHLQERYPKLKVIENVLFTCEDGIYTSAGIASGIDLALYLIEEMFGAYFAHKVARELVIYTRRDGRNKQHSELLKYRNHIHSGIHTVQDWLQDHLHVGANLLDLAAMANMSDRNFTRIFKKSTSLTVKAYVEKLREEKINQLLKQPDLSRIEIARQCGLKSERQLARIIQSMKNQLPNKS